MAAATPPAASPLAEPPHTTPLSSHRVYRVAVIGNPNTGKTTLFNALTGLSQHTGNYPGVTVESTLGEFRQDDTQFEAIDLPGTYSLAPRAPDEMLAVSVLLEYGRGSVTPDVILCVVDATNLGRNLYLTTQIIDVGRPVVIALSMVDLAQKQGIHIHIARLEKRLGIPIVPVQAAKRQGLDQLRLALRNAVHHPVLPPRPVTFPQAFTAEVNELTQALIENNRQVEGQAGYSAQPIQPTPPRFLVERLLIDAGGMIERDLTRERGEWIRIQTQAARQRLADAGIPLPQMEVDSRYEWIAQVVEKARGATPPFQQKPQSRQNWQNCSDRLDHIVTHKVWGLIVFLAVMGITFQSIFSWALPLMDGIDGVFSAIGTWVGGTLSEGPLQSLIVDGLIGGVGAVIVFVPQIAMLFGLIAILEDSGYMARAAFLMDRLMAGFGLSGRSFIPLLSSCACAVPGIMAARTIENKRDRIATIVIAPLMSCSARLPVYVLLISAFIPAQTVWGVVGLQGLVLFSMYILGLIVAPPIAWALKRTVLRGEVVPFLMELPPFKMPAWRVILFRMYDRSMAFLRRAGTIILATTIVVWALSYYPNHDRVTAQFEAQRTAVSPQVRHQRERAQASIRLRESYLGQAGRAIEPFVQPLGWDWKIGMATLASFPAREVIIAALGTIYNVGGGLEEKSLELRDAMRAERRADGRPVYTPVVAVSIMVFFALCCQCGATLATMKRETNSWGYPAFTFIYMTSLAYLGAWTVYQIGSRIVG